MPPCGSPLWFRASIARTSISSQYSPKAEWHAASTGVQTASTLFQANASRHWSREQRAAGEEDEDRHIGANRRGKRWHTKTRRPRLPFAYSGSSKLQAESIGRRTELRTSGRYRPLHPVFYVDALPPEISKTTSPARIVQQICTGVAIRPFRQLCSQASFRLGRNVIHANAISKVCLLSS